MLTVSHLTSLHAGDVTWTNGGGTSAWNLTDANWSTGMWNNANGDGAVFGATGAGAIDVNSAINATSLEFEANGYTLNGTGPLTFVNGTSAAGVSSIFVNSGITSTINTPINSSLGLQKYGAGTLQLAGPITFSGVGLTPTSGKNIIPVDIYVAGLSQTVAGGTIQVMNTSVLPATTRLGLINGSWDFGSNNQTLGSVTFNNDQDFTPFNPATNSAGVGIIGTGTLRVTGEINVLGNTAGFNGGSNSIAMNLDLGGGTQVVRVGASVPSSAQTALQFTGVLSNGSLLKTYGFNNNGQMNGSDGVSLFNNNTYTGSTIINGGVGNTVTGTNASTYVEVAGNGAALSIQGANGSFLSATTVLVASGAQLILDNTLTNGNAGNTVDTPFFPAAQNNNRLADNASLQLRDGTFTYKGFSNTTATETIGSLSVLGGNDTITLTPGGTTGTVAVTVAGDLTMAPRSALTIQSLTGTLGGNAQMFVNGALPAADATGILPRIVNNTGFLTYNGTTGFTPYTGYATDFSTPGTNVNVTAASTVSSSVNINALKRGTTSFTTTIGSGVTLGITSGMIFNAGGTGTFTGGTIDFGSASGAFWGTNIVNSALTGSNGLLNATGTLTLNGDLSGLTGTITQNGTGTTTLTTNTFGGALEVRAGTFNINASQTLAGEGAITLGVSANDANLVAQTQNLNISGAGANATIGRDIIVNNGGQNSAGVIYGPTFTSALTVLSNTTGSQTVSGNITLDSPLRLTGGTATATSTGATNFTGNISGSSYFYVVNGRAVFSGNLSNTGGFYIGDQSNTAKVTFNGTTTGSAPLLLYGSGSASNLTTISYTSNALPTGTITTSNVDSASVDYLTPLDNSTINNHFALDGVVNIPTFSNTFVGGDVGANVGPGISATWAGQMSGLGGVVKIGTGTLTLSNASNTYTGNNTINAGTLLINGSNTASLTTVNNTGTLGGTGNMSGPVTVNTGGTISPGINGIGTFATGSLSLSGTFLAGINLNNGGPASAGLLKLTGSFNITGAILALSLSNLPANFSGGTYVLVLNAGSSAISGTFSSITGLPGGLTATVDYGFNGTDSLGRIGDGNDLAVTIVVPEPQTLALLVLGWPAAVYALRRRRS